MQDFSTVEISRYLQSTGNRDKVMASLTFIPMALAQPIGKFASVPLAESLGRLSALCDGYRTVTRLSGLFDVLQPRNIMEALSIPNPLVRNLALLETACSVGFFPAEHLALFTKFNILFSGSVDRFKHYSALAVFFWLWGLVFKIVRNTVMLVAKRNQIEANGGNSATTQNLKAQVKVHQLKLVNAVAYFFFALSCVGSKVRLFYGPTNVITAPVNAVFEALSPPRVEMAMWVRGLLGIVATTVEYMM